MLPCASLRPLRPGAWRAPRTFPTTSTGTMGSWCGRPSRREYMLGMEPTLCGQSGGLRGVNMSIDGSGQEPARLTQ